MLSIPDMALLGAAALLLFGPEQLPRVMRKAGTVMREIQNTSQSFIREMERAADTQDAAATSPRGAWTGGIASESAATTVTEEPYEPYGPYEPPVYTDVVSTSSAAFRDFEPPAPDPDPPEGPVSEKLAEPRPAPGLGAPPAALDFADAPTQPLDLANAPTVMRPAVKPSSAAAEPPPQPDHPAHF